MLSKLLLRPKPLLHHHYLLLSKLRPLSTTQQPPFTDFADYLDESGALIQTTKAVRPTIPGHDSTTLSGSHPRPLSPTLAASHISSIALRWRWGPDLHSHLDSLPFPPSPSLLHLALVSIPNDPLASLSLLLWSLPKPWWTPHDPTFSLVISRLADSSPSHLDSLESLLNNSILTESLPESLNLAVRVLCKSARLEPAFNAFKFLRDSGRGVELQVETSNALINLFLSSGLPYKAFEVYELMEKSGRRADFATKELLIPAFARSGRIDSAVRLYNELIHGDENEKEKGRPGFGVFSVLVDCLAKSGRLDHAVRVYEEMKEMGYKASGGVYGCLVESFVKAGKLDAGMGLWDEMRSCGFRPNFALYTMMVEAHARSGKMEVANRLFVEMEKAGFLPTPGTYASMIEINSSAGLVDAAMKLYNSMINAGLKPGLTTYVSLLTVLANKKLVDLAAKILLEMRAVGFSVDVNASDVLMVFIKGGSTDLALRWLQFMGSAGLRTNNFIVRQLFDSCMKGGAYDSARPLLENYISSGAKVDLILYTSILAHLVRCKDEEKERELMGLLGATDHKAHAFLCGLFTGPEQRKMPVLAFVREFFQGLDYELEESAARYFVNVLLNYLVLMGQLNRARCVWKVAYEAKLFPKAIVFDQHIAWSLDVRNLSVGAALAATVHTLHRFRKRMLYYGVVPRRIKLVTGSTLRMVVAKALAAVESPFEVSKVVLRAPGDLVLEWFKKPIVKQFLLNEIPSRGDVLMHRLDVMFPSSTAEVRSLSPPKPPAGMRTSSPRGL